MLSFEIVTVQGVVSMKRWNVHIFPDISSLSREFVFGMIEHTLDLKSSAIKAEHTLYLI